MRAQGIEPGTHTPELRIYVLGRFLLERDGEPVPDVVWERRKARALLKLLAIAPGQRMHVDEIQDLLWPEHDESSANNNFRRTLHIARHALEPDLTSGRSSSYLRLGNDVLTLDADHTWIDVVALDAAVDHARSSGEIEAFEQAIALYGGELLPEDRNEDWVVQKREALVRSHVETLVRYAEALGRVGRTDDAVSRLQEIVEIEPGHEEAHRKLMRLFALAGERHQALRQYQECRRALRQQVDAHPEPETEQLYADIRVGKIGIPRIRPAGHAATILPPALRRLHEGAFVGRERALDVLLADPALQPDLPDASASGHRRATLLVAGEAGVGKTRLLVEAGRKAAGRGVLLLWGTAYESESRLPYAPFVEALDRHVANADTEERRRLAGELPELGRLLPSLTALVNPTARGQLEAEIVRYLSDLAGTAPLTFVIDDLHAADSASLHLFHQLARLSSEQAWTLIGAYREGNAPEGSELHRTVLSLQQAECVREIHLLRLGQSDCERLVRDLLPDADPGQELITQLFALSLGNPLFVRELVRTMRDEETLQLRDGQWEIVHDSMRQTGTSVPERIRHLVLSQVDVLGTSTADVITVAAAVGMEWSFELLVAAMGRLAPGPARDDEVLDALDGAMKAQLLEERDGGYVFRHPLFPEAIYRRLTGPRRTRLHLALGRALEDLQSESVESLAHHYTRSGDRGKARLYLEQSADRARLLYAHTLAEEQYRELLELFGSRAQVADIARVREHLAESLANADRTAEARDEYECAAESYEAAGDLPGLARVTAALVECEISMYGYGEPQRLRLERMIGVLEGMGDRSVGLAALHSQMMRMHYQSREYLDALASSGRAVELARAGNDANLLGVTERQHGFILIVLDRHREARELLETCIPWCESQGFFRSMGANLVNLGETYRLDGDMHRLVECERRALRALERTASPFLIGSASAFLAHALFYAGDWKAARPLLDTALDLLARTAPGNTAAGAGVMVVAATLAFAEGRWDDLPQRLAPALDSDAADVDPRSFRDAQILMAERDLAEGRPQEALARLVHLPARAPGLEGHVVCVSPSLARCYLALGDVARADAIMADILPRARALGMRVYMPDILSTHGLVQAHLGCLDEARASFREAIDTARGMPCPWLEARAMMQYGIASRILGDIATSRDRIRDAEGIFQALGANVHHAL